MKILICHCTKWLTEYSGLHKISGNQRQKNYVGDDLTESLRRKMKKTLLCPKTLNSYWDYVLRCVYIQCKVTCFIGANGKVLIVVGLQGWHLWSAARAALYWSWLVAASSSWFQPVPAGSRQVPSTHHSAQPGWSAMAECLCQSIFRAENLLYFYLFIFFSLPKSFKISNKLHDFCLFCL